MIEKKTKKQKSWREKLEDSKGLPKVEKITEKMSKRWGSGTVVIPAPREVDDIMKKVGKGKLITINQIREILARKHKASIGCPITTGIFAWVSAHAAEEARREGEKDTSNISIPLDNEGPRPPQVVWPRPSLSDPIGI